MEVVDFVEQRVVMVDHFGICKVVVVVGGIITAVEVLMVVEAQGVVVGDVVVVVVQGVGSFSL